MLEQSHSKETPFGKFKPNPHKTVEGQNTLQTENNHRLHDHWIWKQLPFRHIATTDPHWPQKRLETRSDGKFWSGYVEKGELVTLVTPAEVVKLARRIVGTEETVRQPLFVPSVGECELQDWLRDNSRQNNTDLHTEMLEVSERRSSIRFRTAKLQKFTVQLDVANERTVYFLTKIQHTKEENQMKTVFEVTRGMWSMAVCVQKKQKP